jgi:putative ABC transport system substrate-binding protein
VAVLSPDAPDAAIGVGTLLDELRRLGHVEARNLSVEYRFGPGWGDRLYAQARDLVSHNVDLIVATSLSALEAARLATGSIPVVGVGMTSGPVGTPRLPRPAENVTGVASVLADPGAAHLGLLRQLAPGASRVAILWNPAHRHRAHLGEIAVAAKAARVRLRSLEVRDPSGFAAAFAAAAAWGADGLVTWGIP